MKKTVRLGTSPTIKPPAGRSLHGMNIHEPATPSLRDKGELLGGMKFEEDEPDVGSTASELVGADLDGQTVELPLDKVVASRFQPRITFPAAAIQKLADAIELANGLLQPILVRPLPDGTFELVGGERRTRACRFLGHTTIKAIVRAMSDKVASVVALMDNDSSESLTSYERAKHLKRHCDLFANGKQIELSKQTGVAPSVINRHFKFFQLPTEIIDLLEHQPDLINEYQLPVIVDLANSDLQATLEALVRVQEGEIPISQVAGVVNAQKGKVVVAPKSQTFSSNTFGVKSATIKGKQLVIKCGDSEASEKLLGEFSAWLDSRKL